MFNISPIPEYHYSEVSQTNFLRWTVVHLEKNKETGEKIWQCKTGKFKCREFFNDLVARKNKRKYCIYGFDNRNVFMYNEGIHLLLSNIENLEEFVRQLKLINKKMKEQVGEKMSIILDPEEEDRVIIKIPMSMFENTYRISLLTALIRASNFSDSSHNSWEEFFADGKPLAKNEGSWTGSPARFVGRTLGFVFPDSVPEVVSKSWWCFSEVFNSEVDKTKRAAQQATTSMIHSNGIVRWS